MKNQKEKTKIFIPFRDSLAIPSLVKMFLDEVDTELQTLWNFFDRLDEEVMNNSVDEYNNTFNKITREFSEMEKWLKKNDYPKNKTLANQFAKRIIYPTVIKLY